MFLGDRCFERAHDVHVTSLSSRSRFFCHSSGSEDFLAVSESRSDTDEQLRQEFPALYFKVSAAIQNVTIYA